MCLSCLIATAKTSSIILSKRGGAGYPHLILGFRRTALSLSSSSNVLAVGLLHGAFIILMDVPSLPKVSKTFNFHHEGMMSFVKETFTAN